ncbi:guanylyl cyclase-activating protein 2-like [Megalops cyprinoides]|uniref:guanylyl cyclase-activating protein 2-like n=1 Tax=Megalops cyprinoides TaxID=118141 RepID=UPI001864D5A8|nr:guanylyl cyclase-activating protein 2-like [Megalops cyprinoides]
MGQVQNTGQSENDEKELELSAIQNLYKKFIEECPSGSLHLHEFKKIFGVTSDSSAESLYMDNIFRSFDLNQDNTLDFVEYVAMLHLVFRGKLEDKLRWSFKVFDKDENGRLDRSEVRSIVRIIHRIKQGTVSDEREKNTLTPEQVCNRIFDLIDVNKDGQITLEEFLEGAERDEWVRKFLTLEVNPSNWVIERQKLKNGMN